MCSNDFCCKTCKFLICNTWFFSWNLVTLVTLLYWYSTETDSAMARKTPPWIRDLRLNPKHRTHRLDLPFGVPSWMMFGVPQNTIPYRLQTAPFFKDAVYILPGLQKMVRNQINPTVALVSKFNYTLFQQSHKSQKGLVERGVYMKSPGCNFSVHICIRSHGEFRGYICTSIKSTS